MNGRDKLNDVLWLWLASNHNRWGLDREGMAVGAHILACFLLVGMCVVPGLGRCQSMSQGHVQACTYSGSMHLPQRSEPAAGLGLVVVRWPPE